MIYFICLPTVRHTSHDDDDDNNNILYLNDTKLIYRGNFTEKLLRVIRFSEDIYYLYCGVVDFFFFVHTKNYCYAIFLEQLKKKPCVQKYNIYERNEFIYQTISILLLIIYKQPLINNNISLLKLLT